MSRRRRVGGILTLFAGLALPQGVRAQQAEEALIRQLDSLMPLIEQARVDARTAREARRDTIEASQPTDSLLVGLVHVLVPVGQTDPARDVVGAAWERSYAGMVDRSPALEENRLYFQWAVDLQDYRPTRATVRKVSGRRWRPKAYMEDRAEQVIGEFLQQDLVEARLAGPWPVPSVRPPQVPTALYRQVAVAPSKAARECLAGSGSQCLVMMGLVDDAYPSSDMYTAAERRHLVLRQANRFRRFTGLLTDCDAGSDAACDEALRRASEEHSRWWAVPVLPEVRGSLLWLALERGGQGAWGRLLDHSAEGALPALEAASGINAEALAGAWQSWLVDHRPVTKGRASSLLPGVLFWSLILIALASRSTRWRLA